MKKIKKLLAMVLTFVMAFSMTTIAFAEESGALAEAERFVSITGEVLEINDNRITVQTGVDDDGEPVLAIFVTWLHTYIIGELAIGEEITGFVRPGPRILPWPPQYNIDVIVVGEIDSEIAVARFELVDDFYISLCRRYRFLAEGVDLVLQDPELEFYETDAVRTMVVLHGAQARDIPATLLYIESVTVLFEQAVHLNGMGIELPIELPGIEPPIYHFNGDEEIDLAEFQRFNRVTGVVLEIDHWNITVQTGVYEDTGEPARVVFVRWLYTYVIGGPFDVGDTITGFARPGIMTLQYPPHYTIDVIVVGEIDELDSLIAVAIFELVDDRYVSLCRRYQFSPEGVDILLPTDVEFIDDGTARTMVVLYGFSTRDIPETLRDIISVTVLFEPFVPFEDPIEEECDLPPIMRFEIGSTTYLLYGNTMTAPAAPFLSADDRAMVPFRVIAEGLGAEIDWDDATRTITLTLGETVVVLTIGVALPGGMGVPVLIGDNTFVPIRFVSESLGAIVVPEIPFIYIYQ